MISSGSDRRILSFVMVKLRLRFVDSCVESGKGKKKGGQWWNVGREELDFNCYAPDGQGVVVAGY